jgi:hypothetical protein
MVGVALLDGLLWRAVGASLEALALSVNHAGRRDPLLGRALEATPVTYRFESANGEHARFLVVGGGQIRATAEVSSAPEVTVTFRHRRGLLALRPTNLLAALIRGDLRQAGNSYHLYRLGYVLGLAERALDPRRARS